MTSQPHDSERSKAADPDRPAQERYSPVDPGQRDNNREGLPASDPPAFNAGRPTQHANTRSDPGQSTAAYDHVPDSARDTSGQPPPPTRRIDSGEQNGDEPGGATDYRGTATDHDSVRTREKEAFGGIKFGSAFFGWLTTIGATILLIAIVSAIAAGIGIDTSVSGQDLRGVGISVAIALLVILFIAYFVGGYVAGRMARFNGARQGLAVWIWAVVVAVILTIVGVIANSQSDITSQVNLPSIPVSTDEVTAGGLIGLAIVLVVTLVAAILGGLAGMRFHRRVDRAGFDTSRDDPQPDQRS